MRFELVSILLDGKYKEVPVSDLDLDPDSATDDEIRTAVAEHLGMDSLSEYVVEPPEEGKTILNMRPTAGFG